jgi:hypothetical protein
VNDTVPEHPASVAAASDPVARKSRRVSAVGRFASAKEGLDTSTDLIRFRTRVDELWSKLAQLRSRESCFTRGMGTKRLRSCAAALATMTAVALAGACNDEPSEPEESTESGGGSGGSTSDACPETPPDLTPAAECTPGTHCRYSVECQSGPVELDFTCALDGSLVVQWNVTPDACAFPFDSCPGTNARCIDGAWRTQQPSDPPQPCERTCPDVRPEPGQAQCVACSFDCSVCDGPRCGYRCPSGDGWTVTTPIPGEEGCGLGMWVFDGACDGP